MKNKAVDLDILSRSFEMKLLAATGYKFNFERCSVCGSKITTSNYLSFQYAGGICDKCNKSHGTIISHPAYSVLRFLNKSPIENISRVTVSQKIKNEIYKILSVFIANNYSKKPKSLELFNYLKGSELNE